MAALPTSSSSAAAAANAAMAVINEHQLFVQDEKRKEAINILGHGMYPDNVDEYKKEFIVPNGCTVVMNAVTGEGTTSTANIKRCKDITRKRDILEILDDPTICDLEILQKYFGPHVRIYTEGQLCPDRACHLLRDDSDDASIMHSSGIKYFKNLPHDHNKIGYIRVHSLINKSIKYKKNVISNHVTFHNANDVNTFLCDLFEHSEYPPQWLVKMYLLENPITVSDESNLNEYFKKQKKRLNDWKLLDTSLEEIVKKGTGTYYYGLCQSIDIFSNYFKYTTKNGYEYATLPKNVKVNSISHAKAYALFQKNSQVLRNQRLAADSLTPKESKLIELQKTLKLLLDRHVLDSRFNIPSNKFPNLDNTVNIEGNRIMESISKRLALSLRSRSKSRSRNRNPKPNSRSASPSKHSRNRSRNRNRNPKPRSASPSKHNGRTIKR
jgi:hypothetical protein